MGLLVHFWKHHSKLEILVSAEAARNVRNARNFTFLLLAEAARHVRNVTFFGLGDRRAKLLKIRILGPSGISLKE